MQLLIIGCGERLAGSPLQPRPTWVHSTAGPAWLSPYPTLPSSRRTLWYYVSPATIELVDTPRHSGA